MARTCKVCRIKFEPKNSTVQMVCSWKCSIEYMKKDKAKKWKAEKKELKEKLKTKSSYEKDLETIFNKYIRVRDNDKPCVSCNALPGTFKLTAGHFYPAGSYKNLRYTEDNVHGQCWFNCNKNRHGNLQEYRRRLMERIGAERVSDLDVMSQQRKNYTIPELIELKVIYKEKIRQHEKSTKQD